MQTKYRDEIEHGSRADCYIYIKGPRYIHQMLLAARASGNEGSNGSAQKDEGNVRERTHQATAGVAVRVRKRMPYGMGVIIYHSHV